MGIFSRFFKKEERFNLKNPSDWKVFHGTDGGVIVDSNTATTVSAFWGGVNLIASTIGALPCVVIENTKNGQRIAREHDQFNLLKNTPGKFYTSIVYRRALIASAIIHGNGYAKIIRDRNTGRPLEYILQDSNAISVFFTETPEGERMWYKNSTTKEVISDENMIHIQGLGVSGITGDSLINKAKSVLSTALSNMSFADAYYKNGAFVGASLSFPTTMTAEQFDRTKAQILNEYTGTENRNKTIVLDGGAKYEFFDLNMNNTESNLTSETITLDIARFLNIPPSKLGIRNQSSYNSEEQQAIAFVQDCLTPWAVAFEQEHNRKIFRSQNSSFSVKLELKGLLRGDIKTRTEFYRTLLDRGVFDQNDVRALEDMNPIGNPVRVVPSNMIPINQIEEFYKKEK